MYILSQDKSLLLEFGRIEISRNLSSRRDEKFLLSAWGRGTDNPVSVGMFPDEDTAEIELQKIVAALKSGAAVYEISAR